jgi:deazaflavin-dependent oxidoreductase (nitroreductase family)
MRERLRSLWFRIVGVSGVNPVTRRLHPPLYRLTGGAWFLGRSLGNLTILLTTTGRRSGKRRVAPLWAYPDDDRLVLVGSNGGSHHVPGWVLNLRAQPTAHAQVFRERRAVRAYEAAGEEYVRLWAMVNAAYPGYEAYLHWAHRTIPLVVLEPAGDG